jgi:hypothetical protein
MVNKTFNQKEEKVNTKVESQQRLYPFALLTASIMDKRKFIFSKGGNRYERTI